MTPEEHMQLHADVEDAVAAALDSAFGTPECGADVLAKLLCCYLNDARTDRGHADEIIAGLRAAHMLGTPAGRA